MKITPPKLNKKVTFFAWINKIRKLGNLLFIIGQDGSGYIQIIVKNKELIAELKETKKGDLLSVAGIVRKKTGSEKELEIELTISSYMK
jgi:aspartyl/asparaginyl-tRNA synthetase